MTAEEHRLLKLLAGSANGATEALLLAVGFTSEVIINLAHANFARLVAESMPTGDGDAQVTRVQITDAGRRARG